MSSDDSTTHPRWDHSSLFPESEPARIARYRRLQSWYREVQLGAEPGRQTSSEKDKTAITKTKWLGSLLDTAQVRKQPTLNFLHPEAARHAAERSEEVKSEGGTLEKVRLKHNMLSSMPLCFNLFGALRSEPAFIDLVRAVFDSHAAAIDRVTCEWAPPSEDHLGDRTAFDAFIAYRSDDGRRSFIGIETKYTEPFSQATHGREGRKAGGALTASGLRYREVSETSGWFTHGSEAATNLEVPAANQLWRNTLLAASLEQSGDLGSGTVAVVAVAGDPGVRKAMNAITPELIDPTRVREVTLDSIVAAARSIDGLRGWAERFDHRYLDVDAPDRTPDYRDPEGPSFGSPLTAPAP
jgi:hypothetical protein